MLLELQGRTVLERLIERIGAARKPELVVLCTTTEREDDELEAVAARLGVKTYRGDREDILVRWLRAADAYDIDFFAACDGDDLFCDPSYIDRVIECHEQTNADYVTCVGLPFGAAPTGIARTALRRVCELKTETSTAGQGRFFANERLVTRAEVHAAHDVRHDDARMTLDYPQDVEFFDAVLSKLEPKDHNASLREIVQLLRDHPELVAINRDLQEEYWRRFNELYPPVELASG
jgi:spore coat polysaccharide biosynthesis protein SpsF (cytidylyltransferase family)